MSNKNAEDYCICCDHSVWNHERVRKVGWSGYVCAICMCEISILDLAPDQFVRKFEFVQESF